MTIHICRRFKGLYIQGLKVVEMESFKVWMFQNFRKAFNLRFGDSGTGGLQVLFSFLAGVRISGVQEFAGSEFKGLKLQIQLKYAVRNGVAAAVSFGIRGGLSVTIGMARCDHCEHPDASQQQLQNT